MHPRSFRRHLVLLSVLLAGCSEVTAPVEQAPQWDLAQSAATVPAGGLVDQFAGSTLDTGKWDIVGHTGWVSQQDRLVITPAAGVADIGVLLSDDFIDLTGSAFSVEISQVAGGHPGVETYMAVVSADLSAFAALTIFGGRLYAVVQPSGQTVGSVGPSVPFNPATHRFLRVREANGILIFETSNNGTAWATRWTRADFFQDLGALRANLGVQSPAGNVNPTPARFEGVNTLVPATPSGLSAVAGGPDRVVLSWTDESVNETGFQIERRTPGGSFTEIATPSSDMVAYEDLSVSPETTYEYRVRGVSLAGGSAYTNTVSTSTPSGPGPDPEPDPETPPVGAISDAFDGQFVDPMLWSVSGPQDWVTQDDRIVIHPAPNVAAYGGLLYALPHTMTGSAFSAEISKIATGSRYTETEVAVTTDDLQEYVLITSIDGRLEAYHQWEGESSWVRVGASLTYDPVAHRFWRIRESGGTIFFEVSPDGSAWTIPQGWSTPDLFEDAWDLHGYIAAGVYDDRNSAPTAAHFEGVNTTVPAIPRGLSATATADDEIQVEWTDVAVNEIGYRIERRASGGVFAQIADLPPGSVHHVDSGLVAGTTYEYRIQAYNASGETRFVGPVSATTDTEPDPDPDPTLGETIDSFDGSALDTELWSVSGPASWVTQNDRLIISPAPNQAGPAALTTTTPREFAGSEFSVEISQVAGGNRFAETYMAVVSADFQEFVTMTNVDGRLYAYRQRAGQSPQRIGSSIAFSESGHRWRRVREETGTVYLETSPNGSAWTVRWTTPTFFQDPGAMLGHVGVRSSTANGSPTPAHFEGVNTHVQ